MLIITMICIVLKAYVYRYNATQLNIDDVVKSSVKKGKKERGEEEEEEECIVLVEVEYKSTVPLAYCTFGIYSEQ